MKRRWCKMLCGLVCEEVNDWRIGREVVFNRTVFKETNSKIDISFLCSLNILTDSYCICWNVFHSIQMPECTVGRRRISNGSCHFVLLTSSKFHKHSVPWFFICLYFQQSGDCLHYQRNDDKFALILIFHNSFVLRQRDDHIFLQQ
jgi:hypothetical protein